MEKILLPTTIEFEDADKENVGKIVVTPCHQGYGTTLGNALRRVLLSSLPGSAVESIKIKGVQHEFSAINGVLEDVIQIILNIKQMAVKSHSAEPIVLNLVKKGIGEVTAADFEKNADVEIINKDLKIATITDKDYTFDLEVIINQGRGYVPVGEKDTKNLDLGTIAIDSLYTPIRDVGYKVENTRVGDVTDYEKLTLNIETNGTITPKDAIAQTTKILMDHFTLILDATGSASGSGDLEEINMEVEESDGDKKKEKKEKKAKKKTAKKTK
ncbi:MAG: DNA-directed RNA polymerase subunit alpha [Candidatus Magasanikbacteria bacterium RIFOXYC2_FULL_40_16]|uniref:DNA-directed RNA polymerase subunit alpha n=3 Tax=Candidatus Magasanikiibacteriota TaxID=1752731 RepID=A0A1F6NG11_9BACT|nr:MAG: DNA-directed RNA polymerase subunit alpha [Candidatus Magasanikbacteria bacterium RIFOXYA2_FULL_40_20]OGH82791.1 MAG: DNA-directed RNA polymerase subunit alpha [Candidatus Magasanikbacteria bacterium RIFOXYB1_FULL_40_15]OGH86975.1 MAG: DNA-directed RNA polymerase subunit alpha [Candidatus Magasanikbacteria bacterium RIFOXYB2_FULL_40_13]OGH87751.1 MAG: DNA-directed RNA polymerase subunit alpha [Candidatus Magasanikbacteria bacterium RIFOXYA1_FULL_40_8]OGH90347.1 MAG: DNA-directed RNA pol